MYPVLHNLEREGALIARRKPVDGRSLVLLALLAATVGVRAYPNPLPTGFGHVRLSFAIRSLDQMEYALISLLIAFGPYLLWKPRTHRAPSS